MLNRLNTIPTCDGRTDRQTDGQTGRRHGIVRAMHTRRAVKINIKDTKILKSVLLMIYFFRSLSKILQKCKDVISQIK